MSFLRRCFSRWLRRNSGTVSNVFRANRSTRYHKLSFEYLEDRLTPANTLISVDFFGNLNITDIGTDNDGSSNHDTLTIWSDSANSRWIIQDPNLLLTTTIPGASGDNTNTVTVPFGAATGVSILVNTLDGEDTLTVDRSLGSFTKFITFNGNSPETKPGDKLIITGGAAVTQASVDFFNLSDGIILLDGELVQFQGLEPIDISGLTIADLVFNLPSTDDNAILEDEGIAGNNILQLRSINNTFETTVFKNPTSSLTINLFDGNDTMQFSSIAPALDLTATLLIDGNADNDIILLNGPVNLVSNSATMFAETVNVSSAFQTAGNITINASGVITGSAGGLLQGSNVNLNTGTSIGTAVNPVNLNAGTLNAVSTGVGSIFLNELDSVTVQNINVPAGDATLVAQGTVFLNTVTASGLISISSVNAAIVDNNDPPAGTINLVSDRLLLQAATGIGSSGAIGSLETNVNFIEAATFTGGIFLSDAGSFDVGNVAPGVLGIRNTGATGNIELNAVGTIQVLNFSEIIQAPGQVTINVGIDLITSGGNPVSSSGAPFEAAIASSSSAIVLNAGRDLRFGFSNGDANPFNDYGDVRAANNVTLTAGRDIIVDENTYVDAGAGLVTGNLIANAGRDIRLIQTNTRDSRMATFGGTITITTGPGGEFELNTGNNPAPGLFGVRTDLVNLTTAGGVGGNITINADDVEIVDVQDIINAGTARVTIQTVTVGRPIDLGTNGTGSNLGLTDFELDRIAAGIVTIGNVSAGAIAVTAAISPALFNTLHLITAANISSTAAGTLTVGQLALEAPGGVTLNNANTVSTLAGTTAGTPFSFTNSTLLTIGVVDGMNGISTTGGAVTLTSPDLAVTQAVNSGAGNINLIPTPGNAVIGIGTAVGSLGVTYGISDAEFALLNSAGLITIGDSFNTGGMQISGSESVGSASLAGKNISLVTGQDITVLGTMTGASQFNLFAGVNLTVTATGILGANVLTMGFGLNGTGAIGTITGTLQSNSQVLINSGVGDDILLFNFTSPTALPVAGVQAVDFGFNNDQLDGPDFNQVFTLTGTDTGTLEAEGGVYQGVIQFSGYEHLSGGTANDRFAFLPLGFVSGDIDGIAGGTNTLDYSNYGSAVTINLSNSTATAIGGNFFNINNFIGYTAPGICSTLIGANLNNDWQITAIDSGTINALPFAGFGDLMGGTLIDVFTFQAAGQLNCDIDGAAGTNTIINNAVGHTFSITGPNSGAIDTLFIGSVTPLLPDPIPCPTSIVTPAAPATRFTNIQNLTGGAGDDRFWFLTPGTLTGSIDGGTGSNTIHGDNAGRTYTITGGGTGTISVLLTAGFTGIQNIIGGTTNDTFIINSIAAVNMSLAGVQGNDIFTINNTGSANLTVCGGDGSDDIMVITTGTGTTDISGDDDVDFLAIRANNGNINASMGNGADVVQMHSLAMTGGLFGLLGNLDNILAPVDVDMGSGSVDRLLLYDVTTPTPNNNVIITNAAVTNLAPAVITYTSANLPADRFTLLANGGAVNNWQVVSTLGNPIDVNRNRTIVVGNVANSVLTVGNAAQTLDDIKSRLEINFFETFLQEQGQTTGYDYLIRRNSVTEVTRYGGLNIPIGIITITPDTHPSPSGNVMQLDLGSGNDNVELQGHTLQTSMTINGHDGDDQFQITATSANSIPATSTSNFNGGAGRDRFFIQSTAGATPGIINLNGEAGDDQFSFINGRLLDNGFINGGDGIDTLDYSQRTIAALVNLRPTPIPINSPLTPGQQRPNTPTPGLPAGVLGMRNQTASGLFNGALTLPGAAGRIAMANASESTIENIVGSSLADAFFGAGEFNRFEGRLGNDYLFGGLGSDILIGNEGDDSIFGEAGDDTIYGAGGRDAMYAGTGFDLILIDSCNDVRPGLRSGDRVLDLGGLGVNGGRIDLIRRVPPLTGAINDPRINYMNNPLIVFQYQALLALRPTSISPLSPIIAW